MDKIKCTCHKLSIGEAYDWQADCPKHGIGSDWYEKEGEKEYFEQYRQYSLDVQALAREARRTGKGLSVPPAPQHPKHPNG